jgi:hypothetical protein
VYGVYKIIAQAAGLIGDMGVSFECFGVWVVTTQAIVARADPDIALEVFM